MKENNFIDSGLLEAVATGIATEEEKELVSKQLISDKEARAEMEEIEICLEKLARYFAIEPSRKRRTEIENEIFPAETEFEQLSQRFLPDAGKFRIYQYISIAATISFLLMAGFGFWGYKNLVHTQEVLTQTKLEYENLSAENQNLYQEQQKMASLSKYLNSEGAVQVVLSSTRKDPMKATLFWNPKTHEIWLVGSNLPKLPEGKQYQMWGIVDGKPTDAGVFNASSTGTMMVPLKPMQQPSMFAVTVEIEGGSKSPTLNTMRLKADI